MVFFLSYTTTDLSNKGKNGSHIQCKWPGLMYQGLKWL